MIKLSGLKGIEKHMLKLTNISKDYIVSKENVVHALKNINISFPDTGFVSILGPSGCGKTTLLNIIGGLDRYSLGDLIVNNTSTKDFTDHDWDDYRNKKTGIVFQSYNLIPQMSILSNVELALSLSGVERRVRKITALEALKDVGLEKEVDKRPNQLSGGQMQRVAIARAIVNNPSIILADEPTGALDSKTSIQVLNILAELAKEKLVIMVTHNSELAYQYSNRIIKMHDGEIVSDEENKPSVELVPSKEKETINPDYTFIESLTSEKISNALNLSSKKKQKKSSMSLKTAISISCQNLKTKKGRTIMTSIAGSIGIIGVALILAISNGFNKFVNNMQTEVLASAPISIEEMYLDPSSLANMAGSDLEEYPDSSEVNVHRSNFSFSTNNITEEYVEYVKSMDESYYSSIQTNYALQTNIVAKNGNNYSILETKQDSVMESLVSSSYWKELPDNDEFVLQEYDLLEGKYPENKNELVLIVDSTNSVSESTLESLGFDTTNDTISFLNVINKEYSKVTNNNYYVKQGSIEVTGRFVKSPEVLKNENINLSKLLEDLINMLTAMSEMTPEGILKAGQIAQEIQTTYFEAEESTRVVSSYQSVQELFTGEALNSKLEELYNNGEKLKIVGILRPKEGSMFPLLSEGVYYTHDLIYSTLEEARNSEVGKEQSNHLVLEKTNILNNEVLLPQVYSTNSSTPVKNLDYSILSSSLFSNLNSVIQDYIEERRLYGTDEVISSITIYPRSFDAKGQILNYLDKWNSDHPDQDPIVYTDLAGTLFSALEIMVDVISAVLIAFSSISLVVSSVMIGIIMYSSVIERTKEIGILRSIGARKKDISRLFKTEATIIGFFAGVFGVLVTVLLCIPANMIFNYLFPDMGLGSLASLNPLHAILLILVSMLLTYISALIPARAGAKKDPVKALRTE